MRRRKGLTERQQRQLAGVDITRWNAYVAGIAPDEYGVCAIHVGNVRTMFRVDDGVARELIKLAGYELYMSSDVIGYKETIGLTEL